MKKICMGLGIASFVIPIITGVLSNGFFGFILGVLSGVLSGGVYIALAAVLDKLDEVLGYAKVTQGKLHAMTAGTKKCAICGREVSYEYTSCPSCGSCDLI